jgi:DNA/RNA-binding domain of Phe-tRNA-synthetase-like protein
MLSISINKELKHLVPNLALACVSARVQVVKHNQDLWGEINRQLAHLTATTTADITSSIPQIAAMRSAYKALGKDPSRYRGSAEALLRRVLSGKGLYQINNVVDINNLVSLESFQPLGSYDLDQLSGPVELRIGLPKETYKGIGKDVINIENLPVFADAKGPFGSPTSDSERAMIRLESKRILMVVFSLVGPETVEATATRAADLLRQYANADQTETTLAV